MPIKPLPYLDTAWAQFGLRLNHSINKSLITAQTRLGLSLRLCAGKSLSLSSKPTGPEPVHLPYARKGSGGGGRVLAYGKK